MSKISEWCKRMEKILPRVERGDLIERNCVYGKNHFCNGRPNRAIKNHPNNTIEPCVHFINGRCEKELHTGKVKKI